MDEHKHGHTHPKTEVDDSDLSYYEAMCWALRDDLLERGFFSADQVRRTLEQMESKGVHLGALVVVNAWLDPAWKKRLLQSGVEAAAEIGIKLTEAELVVVENSENEHNLIVCTLCSCYPRSLLGQPPSWYVSKTYRSRAVREPRKVLEEFGLHLPHHQTVRVHDSTADMRYMVLPMRPEGTEGWTKQELAALISRDMLIGTAVPTIPQTVSSDGKK